MTPFLLRFSERIPPQPPVRLRYDAVRQTSLVESSGSLESVTRPVILSQTRVTKVQSETTDDN